MPWGVPPTIPIDTTPVSDWNSAITPTRFPDPSPAHHGPSLPSYYPDYNPIEYLWKKTKQRGTHNKYFQEFSALIGSVAEALTYFSMHADELLCLFGRYQEESELDLQQAV